MPMRKIRTMLEMTVPSDCRGVIVMVVLAALLLATGCAGTVAPWPVVPSQPSWSGSQQNSGMLRMVADGWIVDGQWVTRYQLLCASKFAAELAPPPDPNACLDLGDGMYLAHFQTVADFAYLNLKKKMQAK